MGELDRHSRVTSDDLHIHGQTVRGDPIRRWRIFGTFHVLTTPVSRSLAFCSPRMLSSRVPARVVLELRRDGDVRCQLRSKRLRPPPRRERPREPQRVHPRLSRRLRVSHQKHAAPRVQSHVKPKPARQRHVRARLHADDLIHAGVHPHGAPPSAAFARATGVDSLSTPSPTSPTSPPLVSGASSCVLVARGRGTSAHVPIAPIAPPSTGPPPPATPPPSRTPRGRGRTIASSNIRASPPRAWAATRERPRGERGEGRVCRTRRREEA